MKLSKELKVIYAVTILISILLIVRRGVLMSPDGYTYISAWNDSYSRGSIDVLRTPVYPFYLGLLKTLFGERLFLIIAIIGHYAFHIISINFFYSLAKYVTSSRQLSIFVTILYAVLPLLTKWYSYILTESFAISWSVLLVWLVIELFKRTTFSKLILFTTLLLTLLFLRPALIYMLPVFIVVFGYYFITSRKKIGLYSMGVVVIASISLLSYMKVFENKYGVFASSSVSTVNQTHIARQYGLFNVDVIDNPKLKEEIIKSNKEYGEEIEDYRLAIDESSRIFKGSDIKSLKTAIYSSYISNPIKWAKKCFSRFYRSSQHSLFNGYIETPATFLEIFGLSLKMSFLYLFLLLYVFIFLFWVVRNNSIPIISCLFFMLGVSNVIVVIVGAQGEWGRLILPSMPLYLLMFAQLCTMFKVKSPLSIEFK